RVAIGIAERPAAQVEAITNVRISVANAAAAVSAAEIRAAIAGNGGPIQALLDLGANSFQHLLIAKVLLQQLLQVLGIADLVLGALQVAQRVRLAGRKVVPEV